MEEEELVSGDGWLSDESSLYGDEKEKQRLTSSDKKLTLDAFMEEQETDLNHLLHKKRSIPPPVLRNPREDDPYSWHLNELAEDFLQRVPPLTTSAVPWIWVANPYPEGQIESDPAKDNDFTTRGQDLLKQSLARRDDIRKANSEKPRAVVSRLLNQEADSLKQQIIELAAETNVVFGKWMLFPALGSLDKVWKAVVEATADNRLGPLAKVATDDGKPTERLICVYTKDFRDTDDVRRVLKELVSMSLVKSERTIYYKTDAYTHLNLYAGNAPDYGLQASHYSSQYLLAGGQRTRAKAIPQKQSTLDTAFRRSNQ